MILKGWNKETIEEQLRLHKRQNKDDRYNYFGREFNCLWYCWELEKYTIKEIQRLNNIIKELEKEFNKTIEEGRSEDHLWLMGYCDASKDYLNRLNELKGSDKK